jgi:oligopeptide transport system substrate-binding protein
VYAHREAIRHYQDALTILREEERYEGAARTLMKLGLTYHTAFDFRQARRAYEEGFTLWQRAGEAELAVSPLPAPHALRVNEWEPRTLDPTMSGDPVTEQLFSGLVELSQELDVAPDVARSWEVSEGGRNYVFHLRDDVRWTDGVPVTAGDFEYAWKRVLAPRPVAGSPAASLLYDVKGARAFHRGEAEWEDVGVRTLDQLTLAVELEGPTGCFLHLLACNATYPIPRHVVEAWEEAWTEIGNIVTNGPFRLETWRRGETMILARNPNYHGRFRGNILQVELSTRHEDSTAKLERYEADSLDVVRLLLPVVIHARRQHPEEYMPAPALFTWYAGFNVSRPPFDDRRVRQAFVLATDRGRLINVVLGGYEAPATGGFIPPAMPGHSTGIGLPYDPERARDLLAEAGYPKGRSFPVVDCILPPDWEVVGDYLKQQWQENLGVEIKLETMESMTLFEKLLDQEPPSIFADSWRADYPDPDSLLRASPIRRHTRWRNEAYDRLVEEARRVMNQKKRMKLYGQADRILIEAAALMPIGYGRAHIFVKPWVSRYPMSAVQPWFWKDVIRFSM